MLLSRNTLNSEKELRSHYEAFFVAISDKIKLDENSLIHCKNSQCFFHITRILAPDGEADSGYDLLGVSVLDQELIKMLPSVTLVFLASAS
ncbi:hypothetical protein [Thalassotalea sediminis]|uniref:hypothetical protein n=1 Tax=Thalassotalea sediminis TaxID=1759089 RepID=UPI00257473C5|nr:hypothetical protein [Thalassotalea sediminis]